MPPANQVTVISDLPDEIFRSIQKKLSIVDMRNLGSLSKGMRSLFKPAVLLNKFLQAIAYGMQDKAETLFTDLYAGDAAKIQKALRHKEEFTDYSGRTFNCSAYEYAYWAKDTHMCSMLIRYMDDETKAKMLTLTDAIETHGLIYQQNGEEHQSAHFDFTPLKDAYQRYIHGFFAWHHAKDLDTIAAAWLNIGKAQRNVPAHVSQEYCRPDRPFRPCPTFTESQLPRVLTFYNPKLPGVFHPPLPADSSLGSDFGVFRGWRARVSPPILVENRVRYAATQDARDDYAAIKKLDEVRTAQLAQLREHLQPSADKASLGP